MIKLLAIHHTINKDFFYQINGDRFAFARI